MIQSPAVELTQIEFPGQTLKAAPTDYSSIANGHFEARVISYGSVQAAPSERDGSMGGVETTIDFDDRDRYFGRLVDGVNGNSLIGSVVYRWMADPNYAALVPTFVGIVTKQPEFPREFVARVTARVDDRSLESLGPKKGWTVDHVSWPNAHKDALTKPAPRPYGIQAAANFQTGPGFCPGLYVDTVKWGYAFAGGRLKSIDKIYVDDVETPSGGGSAWSSSYAVDGRNRVWTLVYFTSDQGDAKITADVHGYESVGDGSGATLEHPGEILQHMLTQWHLQEWKNGAAWFPTDARIGTSLTSGVVKAWIDARAMKAAPKYYERLTGYSVIKDFCDNLGVRAYWRNGLLEFCVEDVSSAPYTGTQMNWALDFYTFEATFDDISVSPAVRFESVRSESQGHYLSSVSANLPDATSDDEEQLSLSWSAAS